MSEAATKGSQIARVVRVKFPENKLPLKLMKYTCPICGADLLLTSVDGCEQDADGVWIASEVALQCVREPNIDSDEWEQWNRNHYRTPYIDWLPLENRILKAVQARYYFAP